MARLVGDEGEAAAAKQLRAREDQIAQLDKDNYYYRQSNKCGPRRRSAARAARRGRCMPPQTRSVPSFCVRHTTDSGTASYWQSTEQSKGTVRRRRETREQANGRTNKRTNKQTNKRTNNERTNKRTNNRTNGRTNG